jgi:hypothetical protein
VLFVRQAHIRHNVLVAPQHLAMAAGRTDAWAAGEPQRSVSVVTVMRQWHGVLQCCGAAAATSGAQAAGDQGCYAPEP